ncbi:MAG: type II toxin-antitoxin system VapC family toxin [Thermoanaerobaculia bacterium]
MRVLVDTHCWLWMQVAPERFSPQVLQLLTAEDNELYLSAASSWEIAIKYALKRLPLPLPPREYVPSRMEASGVRGLPVEHVHALEAGELPPHHRDPFDRLLIAQARVEGFPILTADSQLRPYEVEVIWAP